MRFWTNLNWGSSEPLQGGNMPYPHHMGQELEKEFESLSEQVKELRVETDEMDMKFLAIDTFLNDLKTLINTLRESL